LWGGGILSCDTPTNSSVDVKIQRERLTGKQAEKKISSIRSDKNRYRCRVTTLNKPGSEKKLSHQVSVHFIDLDDSTRKSVAKESESSYKFTFTQQNAPKKAIDNTHHSHAVRVAECILPDSEEVLSQVESQLSEFGKDSWVNHSRGSHKIQTHLERYELEQSDNTNNLKLQTAGDCGWFCQQVWITVTTINGEVISIVITCDPEAWIYLCEEIPIDGGGLSEPIGEEEPCDDPTQLCDSGPSGPVQVDECEWMINPPPGMCGDSPEECDTDDPILDDGIVQLAMYNAWNESYGPNNDPLDDADRRERMFMVTATSSGYEVEELPPNQNTTACHFDTDVSSLPSNIVALFHTHPFADGENVNAPDCPPAYDGDYVSQADRNRVESIANNPGLSAIPMYVMDENKIWVLDPSDTSQYSQNFDRCGY